MSVKLWLIGTCRLTIDDVPVELTGNKLLALLAYMATERGPHTREILMTLFWGENPQERAMNSLRQFLYKLRVLLPEGILETARLTAGIPDDVDLWTDVAVLQAAANAGNPSNDMLIQAAGLINGPFMNGVNLPDAPEFDAWQLQKRHVVRMQSQRVLERLIDQVQAAGDIKQATGLAEQLVNLEPTNEKNHQRLMQLYMDANQPDLAVNHYHLFVETLDREAGEQPEAETQQLYRSILQQATPLADTMPGKDGITSIYPHRPLLSVGREDDLANLLTLLQSHPIVAVQGWPGVGKSTVAALLAHSSEAAAQFPDGILWTAVERDARPATLLRRWAQTLGLVDGSAQHETVTERLRHYLNDKRVLLIVDDVWDAAVVQEFMIGGEACRLLFTTRQNDVARAATQSPDEVYRLNILSNDDAMTLLKQLAPDVVDHHPRDVQTLINDLEGLPLALQVAGRLLQFEYEMGWGIKELLAGLREGSQLLQAQAPQDRSSDEGIPVTVTALITQSTERLNDEQCLRFAALGVFAPKPATFSAKALAAIWQVDDPRDTIRLFVGRGLMEPAGDGRFVVHALLIAHARSLFGV